MTRLWIDGTEAVLPDSFTLTVKRENPFFTKNGEYTYDITLSLRNPVNAKLYEYLDRLNSVTEVKTKRQAILVADNRTYCRGTEVITSWNEKQVTIQVASGNSELNYLIGNDLQMEWLKLNTNEDAYDYIGMIGNPSNFITKCYPEINACLAPYTSEGSREIQNEWMVMSGGTPMKSDRLFHLYVLQPYLCTIMKRIATALGYEMKVNQLEDTPFKYLYFVHGLTGMKDYSEIFQGWSVGELLEQIETMFNGLFVVNNRTKELNFILKNRFFDGVGTNHVRLVEDAYEVDCPEESEVSDMSECNVGYSGSTDWWKWQCLAEDLVKSARRESIPSGYPDGNFVRPYNFFLDPSHQRKDTLYTDETNGRQYIWVGEELGNHDVSWGWENDPIIRYRQVNGMAKLVRDEEADDVNLEIAPSDMAWADAPKDALNGKTYVVSIPVAKRYYNAITEDATTEELDINGRITGEQSSTSDESKSELVLAFYAGLKQIDSIEGKSIMYPVPYVLDSYELPGYITLAYRDSNSEGVSLSPACLNRYFYSTGYVIDTKKEVKLKSYDVNLFDPSAIFEANNKRYVCKEIEYTLDSNGRRGAWQATLYPITISDTEADAKWILSDGKWRDGGVWIDNGRWLDD